MQVQQANYEKDLGNRHFNEHRYDEALVRYNRALQLNRQSAVLWGNRAMLYLKMNRNTEAIGDCLKALQLDSTYVKAWFRKSISLANIGKVEEAVQDMQTVITFDPNNREAHNKLIQFQKIICDCPSKCYPLPDVTPWSHAFHSKSSMVAIEICEEKLTKPMDTQCPPSVQTDILEKLNVPTNCARFVTDWKMVRHDCELRSEYFLAIPIHKYTLLFEHCLDSDLMQDFIQCLSLVSDPRSRLVALSRLSSIHIILMLIDDKHMQEAKRMVEAALNQQTTDPNDLHVLKKLFM